MSDCEAVYKLLGLLKSHKRRISILIVSMMLTTGLNLCIPLLSKTLMDEGFMGGDRELLFQIVILLAGVQITNAFINVINEKNRIHISTQIEYELSHKALRHLLQIKEDYFDRTNTAEIMNIIYTDIGNMTSITERGMFFIFNQLFSIAGGVIGLFVINSKLVVLVLLFVPLKYFVAKLFARKQKVLMDSYIETSRDYSKWFGDMVGGIQEIRFFDLAEQKEREFIKKQSNVIKEKKKMNLNGQWNASADGILLEILTMFLYIVGANQIFSLKASIGSIFAFITYSCYVTSPISSILNIKYMLAGILPSTKRFYSFMAFEEEPVGGAGEIPCFGDLEFRKVCFSYDEKYPVLQEVSYRFEKGTKTALVGENGAGKTTMLKLLARIYQPQSGMILLNGKNIEDYELKAYRNLIAVVSQQVYLFDNSIRNNIILYKEIEEEILNSVLEDCGLWEFVQEVGLDYQVGRDGTFLSGGQKQKIALARALIQNKPIIIFDEPTSNADVKSELRLNSLFQTRLKDKTVIVITHRNEILEVVDEIVKLENGKLAYSLP